MIAATSGTDSFVFIGREYPRTLMDIGDRFAIPDLPSLVSQYLYDKHHSDFPQHNSHNRPLLAPDSNKRVYVYHSASVTFYAPSDPSGVNGMRREQVRATPSWHGGPPRYDCVFLSGDPDVLGFEGLLVGRVRLFFSFMYLGCLHSCALVDWFSTHGNRPDEDSGMWIVTPDIGPRGIRRQGVVSVESIVRGAHLIPVYGQEFLPLNFDSKNIDVLDVFVAYYVNKFADHHTHTLAQ